MSPRRTSAVAALACTVALACSEPEREGARSHPKPSPTANSSCYPPSEEAAVTGHWPIPPECEDQED